MRLFMNCLTSKSLYILTDSQTDKTEIATEKGADNLKTGFESLGPQKFPRRNKSGYLFCLNKVSTGLCLDKVTT